MSNQATQPQPINFAQFQREVQSLINHYKHFTPVQVLTHRDSLFYVVCDTRDEKGQTIITRYGKIVGHDIANRVIIQLISKQFAIGVTPSE